MKYHKSIEKRQKTWYNVSCAILYLRRLRLGRLDRIKDKIKYGIKATDERIEKHRGSNKLRASAFFIAPLIILLALEVMHLSDIKASAVFFLPGQFWGIKVLFTYVFILACQGVLTVIFRKLTIAYIINSVFFYLLSLVTYVTLDLTGDPLLPSDILLAKNIKEIASFVEIPFDITYVLTLVVMVIGYFLIRKMVKTSGKKFSLKIRLAFDLLLILMFATVTYYYCFHYNFRHRTMDKLNIEIAAFNPVDNLRKNGLVLTFFPRIGDLIVEEPEHYSKSYVDSLNQKYEELENLGSADETEVKPTVILIQNEAWWDPTELTNVEFSKDPMEYTEYLEKLGYNVGKLITPVFSGGTCMPEFEALTGYSTAFLPASSYPYIQHIFDKTPSFVSTYKENGYETVAIHPYHINFYNRSKAYPLLGFDKVYGISDMPDLEKKGWYASDDYAVKQVIKAFENKEAENMFCFLVTMQNHGAYTPKRYENYDIEVTSDKLSETDLQGLSDFTQGVYDSNMAFKTLVEYFSNRNEPVIIAMYGDHQPLLGTDGSTYIDGGLIEKTDMFVSTQHPELYKTPYVVWSNYGADIDMPEYISSAKLGLELVKNAKLDKVPQYFSLIDEFYKLYPAFVKNMVYDNNSEFMKTISDEHKEIEEDYKMLQYDLLHGKKYSINLQTE